MPLPMDEMTNTQRLPSVAGITQPDVANRQKPWAGGGLSPLTSPRATPLTPRIPSGLYYPAPCLGHICLRFAIHEGKREITEELKIIFPQRQDNGAVTWETKGLLSSSHSSFPAAFPKLKDSRKQVPAHGPLEFCSHW